MKLRPFRHVPRDAREWVRWMEEQPEYAAADHTHESDDTDTSVLTNYSITDQVLLITSNAALFDLSKGNSAYIDLENATGTVTISISGQASSGQTKFNLEIAQGSVARAITWPSSFTWPGGTAPTLTATNNAVDVVRGYTRNNGAAWRCRFDQNYS